MDNIVYLLNEAQILAIMKPENIKVGIIIKDGKIVVCREYYDNGEVKTEMI